MAKKKDKTFTKDQILNSKRYESYKDIVAVVLKDGEYTHDDVNTKIKNFLEGKVI